MDHELRAAKQYDIRYWLAHLLVRLAHRIKGTTFYQAIRTPDGSAALITANTWGGGVTGTRNIGWMFADYCDPAWPTLKEFDDFNEALKWAYGKDDDDPKQGRVAENSETMA